MRILILKNNTSPEPQIQHALSWHKSHLPLNFQIEEKEVNFNLQFTDSFGTNKDGKMYGLTGVKEQVRAIVPEGKYDVVVFVYGLDTYMKPDGQVYSWTTWNPLYQGTEWCEIHNTKEDQIVPEGYTDNWTFVSLTHELFHAYCKKIARLGRPIVDEMDLTYLPTPTPYSINNPDSTDPNCNFAHTLNNLKPYLNLLDTMLTYKHFSAQEVAQWKLTQTMWQILDNAREFSGIPFVISSGLRTIDQNNLAGGVSHSAHLLGEAADIHCTDDISRWKMINGAIKAGFTRIGVYPNHLHFDCGTVEQGYVQSLVWFNTKD